MHPDKLDESLTQEDRDKAYERFLAIDKAWKLLNNQESRVNLDKQLKGRMFFDIFLVNSEWLLWCAVTIYLVLILELTALPEMDYMCLIIIITLS